VPTMAEDSVGLTVGREGSRAHNGGGLGAMGNCDAFSPRDPVRRRAKWREGGENHFSSGPHKN
jgi:hypothetical protein